MAAYFRPKKQTQTKPIRRPATGNPKLQMLNSKQIEQGWGVKGAKTVFLVLKIRILQKMNKNCYKMAGLLKNAAIFVIFRRSAMDYLQ